MGRDRGVSEATRDGVKRLLLACLVAGCTQRPAPDVTPTPVATPQSVQGPYHVEVYAEGLPSARHMALGKDGTLFVGSNAGSVYALPDADHDFKPDRVVTLLEGLNKPNGVEVDGDDLIVAEIDAVKRYPGLAKLPAKAPPGELIAELPKEGHHGPRVLRKGPDGALYVTVGVPANVAEMGPPYGTILRLEKGAKPQVYARGIRNSMGLDWHPETDELWFSDNGRDWLGDDSPPEELNRCSAIDQHFGFPYRHGKAVVDPEFGTKAQAGLNMIPPVVELQAHSAPLGMRFYRGEMLPAEHRGNIILATHGSWNRSAPVGYQVLSVNPKTGERQVLIGDWLQGRSVKARPVDVQELADGSLVISSDHSGQIFRLTYGNQTPAP